MTFFSNLFYGFGRPVVLALALIIGLGMISDDSQSGLRGADGFACRGMTNNPDINRALCRLNPARIWNTPIAELISGLGG
ncbi:hypothetical protein [Actibacterium sp. 188UL27-1]|uniref:hypothetical protein n=1 Tax=Actibacterium sp. 188UL27-1 TaxID=2786961 RepID=UPI00195A0D2C|nr:hypothetical protein [Actibacterium sp. 188UL27-1]MBM7067923.1 hypothetical protein [Actibacterium sp. 188UL27-1]